MKMQKNAEGSLHVSELAQQKQHPQFILSIHSLLESIWLTSKKDDELRSLVEGHQT